MFGVLPPGVRISESFSPFTDSTLLSPSPVPSWPACLGTIAGSVINNNIGSTDRLVIFIETGVSLLMSSVRWRVLVWNGGAGRTTLEVLRLCNNLEVVHCDQSPQHYDLLQQLLDSRQISWKQPIEGQISEDRQFRLEDNETRSSLLSERNNTVSFLCSTIGRFWIPTS